MSKSKKKSSRRSKSSEWTAETIPPNNDSGGVNSHTTKAAPARNNHQHGAVTGTSTNHDGDGEGPHDAVSPHEAITLQNDSSSNVETAGSFSSKRKGISTTCNDEESEVAQTQCKRPKAGYSGLHGRKIEEDEEESDKNNYRGCVVLYLKYLSPKTTNVDLCDWLSNNCNVDFITAKIIKGNNARVILNITDDLLGPTIDVINRTSFSLGRHPEGIHDEIYRVEASLFIDDDDSPTEGFRASSGLESSPILSNKSDDKGTEGTNGDTECTTRNNWRDGTSNASAGSKSAKVDVFFEQHNAQEEDDTSVDINDLKEKSDDEEAGEGDEKWELIGVPAKGKECDVEGCTSCKFYISYDYICIASLQSDSIHTIISYSISFSGA